MADAAGRGAGDEGRNPILDPRAPPLPAPHFRSRIPSLAAVQPGCPAGSLHRVDAGWDHQRSSLPASPVVFSAHPS
ncbi:hypothetical protein ABZP36_002292 [Zizania latifolia]